MELLIVAAVLSVSIIAAARMGKSNE